MKKGQELIVDIVDVEYPGYGIGYFEDFKVKIKGAVTGQKVRAIIKKIRGNVIEADAVEIVKRAAYEREGICSSFGACGGCTYLNMDYAEQLKIKENMVKKLLDGAGITQYDFLGIQASPLEFSYRNKMEFTFGRDSAGSLTLGMHKRGRFFEVVNLDTCVLVDEDFIKILNCALEYAANNHLPYYDSRTHSGFLRHLVVRKAFKTGEILVNIVTTTQMNCDFDQFINAIKDIRLRGKIVGILHTYNDRLSDAVICERLEVLYGRDYIIEELLGLKFKISPFSFFQTNTYGAEALYNMARKFAGDLTDKIVFDLYCGTGTIGIIMAPKAKMVIGIELMEEAVKAAQENARFNRLSNCTFYTGDVAEVLTKINDKPDVVVVDPPRSGIGPKAINNIVKFGPDTIVYVSCNPQTLAADLRIFEDAGYKVKCVECMDMFPHTYHVETVARIQKEYN
ncbi:23S rRNA (uracil(1939)-C(5))-methyltransferase RlmD [Caldanaerobius fijiensis]|nr:23S rRNA (uracil(1939)-C(5))-methyltransferase RlmD [Caldanaerobius fijiensis]